MADGGRLEDLSIITCNEIFFGASELSRNRSGQSLCIHFHHAHVARPLIETPKSSARAIEERKRENLTLFDWMSVYAYVDTLPQPINQGQVVKYFATRENHALFFTQSTLSHETDYP